jgi:HK97 family phage prohead protease
MLLPIQIKNYEIKEEDGKEYYYIEGYASVYNNVDLGGDRVLPGFFTEDLAKRGNERKALWQHQRSEPLGINTYTDTEEGLQFTAKLPANDMMVSKRLIPQLEMGTIEGASIGYSVIESQYNREKGCRDLIKGMLYESSFVSEPMNQECVIYSISKLKEKSKEIQEESLKEMLNVLIKSYDIKPESVSKTVPSYKNYSQMPTDTKWSKSKAVGQIKEKTDSKEEPKSSYKNGFMYYDQKESDSFGSYKLPYVYVVDGEFKFVPKAIFSIAAALSGARGGINIPEEDKTKIKSQVNKYYEKMGREPPFKGKQTFIDIDTIKCFEKKDFEKLFDIESGIILSAHAKDYVVNRIILSESKTDEREKEAPIVQDDVTKELRELNKELDKQLKGEKYVR